MKEVREERFTKREDVGFNPAPIPETPPAHSRGEVSRAEGAIERANERTPVAQRHEEVPSATAYVITVPTTRRKTRQSFDIFQDQYDALKKIQLAEADQAEHLHGRKLGELVQEALDAFIKERAKKLGTISIRRGHE
jgi:hypothetical protein